jgi:hypothetical protein
MSRSNKISWKLLVLIALVSSFIFCSEVCAVKNEGKKAVQIEQKEEKKAVCTKQKEEKKVLKEEQKCENKAAKLEQIGN